MILSTVLIPVVLIGLVILYTINPKDHVERD